MYEAVNSNDVFFAVSEPCLHGDTNFHDHTKRGSGHSEKIIGYDLD